MAKPKEIDSYSSNAWKLRGEEDMKYTKMPGIKENHKSNLK